MMKKNLLTLCLICVISTIATARINPFVPTSEFTKPKVNENDGNRTIKIMGDQPPLKVVEILPVVEPKDHINNIVVKTDSNITQPKKDCNITIIDKPKPKIAKVIKPKPKPKPKVIKKDNLTYKFSNIATVRVLHNHIYLNSKYKLKRYIVLEDENKIAFDFKAKISFQTKRKNISNTRYFSKIVIGDHPESSYFRVVIKTKYDVKKYKVDLTKKAMIKISKVK
jgi:hypothetical protein